MKRIVSQIPSIEKKIFFLQLPMYLHPLLREAANPSSSSMKQKRMMLSRCGCKLRKLNDVAEEDNAMQIESKIASKESQEETLSVSAKSKLYELCCMKHWKMPVYECFDEGPAHKKLFKAKAMVEMKEDSGITVLECFGEPQPKKKMAAEQAAEAALWYLKNLGHTLETEKASGRKRNLITYVTV